MLMARKKSRNNLSFKEDLFFRASLVLIWVTAPNTAVPSLEIMEFLKLLVRTLKTRKESLKK